MDEIQRIITNLQGELNKTGAKLKPDGLMGARTYQACLAYQKHPTIIPPLPDKKDWRLARSLIVLRAQLDLLYPDRSKLSDGAIGDTAHKTRESDHNPWIVDPEGGTVVSAIDITHDPVHGVDCAAIAARIKDDSRVKYVIWNKRIYNAGVAPIWREYKGASPHDKHMHVSVKSIQKFYDSEVTWKIV